MIFDFFKLSKMSTTNQTIIPPFSLELKQVALVAENLEEVVSHISNVFGLQVCVKDYGVQQFGLSNALMAFQETFIEVISPIQEGTTAGRLLEKKDGDCGYMVLFQTDQLAIPKKHLELSSVEIILDAQVEESKLIHLHPKQLGTIVSVDEMNPKDNWVWAGPNYKSCQGSELVTKVMGVELQSADPEKRAKIWASTFNRDLLPDSGTFRIKLEQGFINFKKLDDDRKEGFTGIFLGVKNKKAILERAASRKLKYENTYVEIGGVIFYLQTETAF